MHEDRFFRGAKYTAGTIAVCIVLAIVGFILYHAARFVNHHIVEPHTQLLQYILLILLAFVVLSYIVGYLTGDFREDVAAWRGDQ